MDPVNTLISAVRELAENGGRLSPETDEALTKLSEGTFETSEEVLASRFDDLDRRVKKLETPTKGAQK